MEDVKQWFKEHVPRTTQLTGQNSYIPPYANFEYQADIFFVTRPENLEYKIGLILIDTFSKFCSVIMLKGKTPDIVLPAMEQAFTNLGGIPRVLYSDSEGAFLSKDLNDFHKKHGITHIITRGHAGVVERMIKTLKDMMFKRLKHEPDKTWYEIIHECLVVLNYMRKSRATGFIPIDARKPENWMKVKNNLERNRNKSRKYPPVSVGDLVHVYRKRKNFEKSAEFGLWSNRKYRIERIEDVPDAGKLYYLDGLPNPVIRAEILI